MKGIEGQVELVGFHAVVGTLLRWSIERREESRSNETSWILRAVFSYQNDVLLKKDTKKRVLLKMPNNPDGTEKWYEAVPEEGTVWKIEDDRLTLEGVTLCRAEPPRRSKS